MNEKKEIYKELLTFAEQAAKSSYSPYSKFAVGAAVLCEDGKVYCGTNIENASYGLTMCAERVALFTAVSNGSKNIKALAVYSENGDVTPCGACRQVIYEFSQKADIVYKDKNNKVKIESIKSLLPKCFNKKSLK
ncbi:MAG: cytidine deaminase [Endomicrobiaceae bacterium]